MKNSILFIFMFLGVLSFGQAGEQLAEATVIDTTYIQQVDSVTFGKVTVNLTIDKKGRVTNRVENIAYLDSVNLATEYFNQAHRADRGLVRYLKEAQHRIDQLQSLKNGYGTFSGETYSKTLTAKNSNVINGEWRATIGGVKYNLEQIGKNTVLVDTLTDARIKVTFRSVGVVRLSQAGAKEFLLDSEADLLVGRNENGKVVMTGKTANGTRVFLRKKD